MSTTMLISSPYLQYKTNQGNSIQLKSMLINQIVTIDDLAHRIVQQCREPQAIETLQQQYGKDIIEFLVEKKILLPNEDIWEQSNVQLIEVECNSFCNYHCDFCPNATESRGHYVMEQSMFEAIVEKAERHPSIDLITINNYGEPTIDPLFSERLKVVSQSRLILHLNTNGSHLGPHLDQLSQMKNLRAVHINIPSVDEEEYHRITGGELKTVLSNVKRANDLGLNCKIIINGTPDEVDRKYLKFMHEFNSFENVEVFKWKTCDRAGLLKNKYYQGIHLEQPFAGCRNVVNYIFVDAHGDLLLCCRDYHKRYMYGNIMNGDIETLLHTPKLIKMKKIIFGENKSDNEFICTRCAEMQENKQAFEAWENYNKMNGGD